MQNLRHHLSRMASVLCGAMALTLSATLGLADSHVARWDDPEGTRRPYIFTQQHNVELPPEQGGRVQIIRLGYPLQVQLPGNPALWTFDANTSRNVEYRGRTMVYSPDRIAGTKSIFVFDLALSPMAANGTEGVIVFTTNEVPASLDKVVPDGKYVIYFKVIDPS